MSKLNVYKNCYYSPWKYPSNWKSNIKLFFKRHKWARQRVKRGFADCDIWNMDEWLLNLFHDALIYLADNHQGWPGDEKFPKDEDWTNYLNDMAQKFYQASETNEFYPTPEADKWWKHICDAIKIGENPYQKTMYEESIENDQKRMRDFAEAWSMMGDVFFNLWD